MLLYVRGRHDGHVREDDGHRSVDGARPARSIGTPVPAPDGQEVPNHPAVGVDGPLPRLLVVVLAEEAEVAEALPVPAQRQRVLVLDVRPRVVAHGVVYDDGVVHEVVRKPRAEAVPGLAEVRVAHEIVSVTRRDRHAAHDEVVAVEEVHQLDERVPEGRPRVRVRAAPRDDELAEDERAPPDVALEEVARRRVVMVDVLRRAVAPAPQAAHGHAVHLPRTLEPARPRTLLRERGARHDPREPPAHRRERAVRLARRAGRDEERHRVVVLERRLDGLGRAQPKWRLLGAKGAHNFRRDEDKPDAE